MKIEILGSGCSKCKTLEQNAKKAVEESGVTAEIVKVEDITRIIEFGVISTPAIVINGKIMASGRIPNIDEIVSWLKK